MVRILCGIAGIFLLLVGSISAQTTTGTDLHSLEAITPENVQRLSQVAVFHGRNNSLRGLAFNEAGTILAITGSAAQAWDVNIGALQDVREYPGENIVFSPDGKRAAFSYPYHDKGVMLWDVSKNSPVTTIGDKEHPIRSFAFSPDSALIVTGGAGESPDGDRVYVNSAVELWDAGSGKFITKFGENYDVDSILFRPDGNLINAFSNFYGTRVWNVQSGKELAVWETGEPYASGVHGLAYSPDGLLLAAAHEQGGMALWDTKLLRPKKVLFTQDDAHFGDVQILSFSSDGSLLATYGTSIIDNNWAYTIKLWDSQTGSEHLSFQIYQFTKGSVNNLESVAVTSDLTIAATAIHIPRDPQKTFPDWYDPYKLSLWDLQTGEELISFDGSPGVIRDMEFSPDNTMLATIGEDDVLRLWAITDGAPYAPIVYGTPDKLFYKSEPTRVSCSASPPSRFNIDMLGAVRVATQAGDTNRDLRVRVTPNGEQVGSMSPGTGFMTIAGPICDSDGLMWWGVQTLDGELRGWSVEGFAPDDYLMVSAEP